MVGEEEVEGGPRPGGGKVNGIPWLEEWKMCCSAGSWS